MRVVSKPDELAGGVRLARSEAATAFGDASVYLERCVHRPRHVEIQILADHHGHIVPFAERECSIQRRHQKVLEESPSAVVDSKLRARLAEAAVAVAKAAGYTNAGTVEFLLDEDGRFYFLEVNARLQVEHPVTEMVAGVDLVRWQIRIAAGAPLTLSSRDTLTPSGHAIECRVYAEDPDAGFLPSPGRITSLRAPSGPGIRDDGWVESGSEVPIYYDSLLSKVITWGEDRRQAAARMRRALAEYEIRGVRSTLAFARWLLGRREFVEARFHTGYLDELLQQRSGESFDDYDPSIEEVAVLAMCLAEATKDTAGRQAGVMTSSAVREHSEVARGGRSWKARARRECLRE